jgi:hypothetical protein
MAIPREQREVQQLKQTIAESKRLVRGLGKVFAEMETSRRQRTRRQSATPTELLSPARPAFAVVDETRQSFRRTFERSVLQRLENNHIHGVDVKVVDDVGNLKLEILCPAAEERRVQQILRNYNWLPITFKILN